MHPPASARGGTGTQSPSARTAATLRGILAARNLDSGHLAAALNCSRASANRRLSGSHNFKLDELEAIAAWLGEPIDTLVLPERSALLTGSPQP